MYCSEDVEVTVDLPPGTKSKQVKVVFKTSSLSIKVPEKDISVDLYNKVSVSAGWRCTI